MYKKDLLHTYVHISDFWGIEERKVYFFKIENLVPSSGGHGPQAVVPRPPHHTEVFPLGRRVRRSQCTVRLAAVRFGCTREEGASEGGKLWRGGRWDGGEGEGEEGEEGEGEGGGG